MLITFYYHIQFYYLYLCLGPKEEEEVEEEGGEEEKGSNKNFHYFHQLSACDSYKK